MCAPSPGGGVTISSDSATSTTNQVSEDLGDFAEDPNPIDDMIEDVEEEYDKLQDVGDQVVSDAEDAADALQNELSDALTNTGTIATNASNALMASLGIGQNRGPNDDQMNAMASMEGDPRLASLMARMRRRRKQGKSQLRKGGGLYIPLKAGFQVQT